MTNVYQCTAADSTPTLVAVDADTVDSLRAVLDARRVELTAEMTRAQLPKEYRV